jgi:hypothetical protein
MIEYCLINKEYQEKLGSFDPSAKLYHFDPDTYCGKNELTTSFLWAVLDD